MSGLLQRLQEGQDGRGVLTFQSFKLPFAVRGFAIVSVNGMFHGGGAAVVQQRSAEAQAPQRGRSDLGTRGGGLIDSVAGSNVVEQKV